MGRPADGSTGWPAGGVGFTAAPPGRHAATAALSGWLHPSCGALSALVDYPAFNRVPS